jgi:hypothetical protein
LSEGWMASEGIDIGERKGDVGVKIDRL